MARQKKEQRDDNTRVNNFEAEKNDWNRYYQQTIKQARMMENFTLMPDKQSSFIEKQTKRIKGRHVSEINKIKMVQSQIESEYMQAAPQAIILPGSKNTPQKIVNIKSGKYRDDWYESKGDWISAKCFWDSLITGYSAIEWVNVQEKPGSSDRCLRLEKPKNSLNVFFDKFARKPNKEDGNFCGYEFTVSVDFAKNEWPDADWDDYKNPRIESAVITRRYEKRYKRQMFYTVRGFDKPIEKKDYDDFVKNHLPALNKLAQERYEANIPVIEAIGGTVEPFIPLIAPEILRKDKTLDWDVWMIHYHKQEILEEEKLPIKSFPLKFWPGNVKEVDDQEIAVPFGLDATVPQQIFNQTVSAIQDQISRAPGARIFAARGAVRNNMQNWADMSNTILGVYDIPPGETAVSAKPSMESAPSFDVNLLAIVEKMEQLITSVLGRSAENMGGESNAHDFGAILLRKMAGDSGAGVWYMGALMTSASVTETWLEWAPHIYNRERIIRIRNKDNTHDYETINSPRIEFDEKNQLILDKISGMVPIENDMTFGEFSVHAIGGPSFAMQKLASIQLMQKLMLEQPQWQSILGDLFGEELPFEWGPVFSQRFKTAGFLNPEVQAQDEGEDYQPPPPTVTEKLQALAGFAELKTQEAKLVTAKADIIKAKSGVINSAVDVQKETVTAIGDSVKAFAEAPSASIAEAIQTLEDLSDANDEMIDELEDAITQNQGESQERGREQPSA